MTHQRLARAGVAAYALLATTQTLGQLAGFSGWLDVIPFLLMPLLGVFLVSAVPGRSRLVTGMAVALVFCWFGDWADWWLLAKIAFFLGAQVAYTVTFWPYRRSSIAARPPLLLAYAAVLLALVVGLSSQAGALAGPVAVYGAMLGVMCVLATGVDRLVGLGALLFLLSDIILACYLFIGPEVIPHSLALNSMTYLPAQLLITLGVVHRATRSPVRPVLVAALSRRGTVPGTH